MKKAILSLFTALSVFCSCHNDTPADKICGFFDKAIEKIETATTTKEINDINDKLMQDIAVFSLSWSEEEYQKWEEELNTSKEVEHAKARYAEAKKARQQQLIQK